jgi:hypothetical protein
MVPTQQQRTNMLLGRRDEQMTMTSASVFTAPRPSVMR